MIKKYIIVLFMAGCTVLLSLNIAPAHHQPIGVDQAVVYFKKQSVSFAQSTARLQNYLSRLAKSDSSSVNFARQALKDCRLQYKNIEFFLNYFLSAVSFVYNTAPVPEVEEPFLEYRDPTGLQVIEQLLFSPDPAGQKKELLQQVSLIRTSAEDLNSLLYNLSIGDEKILESIRLELINIMTLGICGFDAPQLKTGIAEAKQSLTTIQTILSPYLAKKTTESDSVAYYLSIALKLTSGGKEFNSFDRLLFLTSAAVPLQKHLGLFIRENNFELNTTGVLNYESGNIFNSNAIDINNRLNVSPRMANLGRRLFFENALSGNNSRSCGSCHQPEKYFTDGLSKSVTLDGLSTVQRNAPGLLYSAFQYSQFWDGRVKDLGEQIRSVLANPIEMNGDHELMVQRLKKDERYRQEFEIAFPNDTREDVINEKNVIQALTAYMKTLAPFSSPFDRYMRGDRSALTKEQVDGFNLFTGKALCATCHTLPLFNGLTPPLYDRTAIEVIGTTRDINFKKPILDTDSGRYLSYALPFYNGAFKTPGLRNVAMTAPYMHNGQFTTLDAVLEFYNKGGGAGMGLDVPYQTLSPYPLKLTESETKNIIAFLQSLTDSLPPVMKLGLSN